MNKERSSRLEGRIRSGTLSRRDIVRRLGELAFGSANDCVRLVLEDCPDLDALELSLLSEVRRSDKGGVEVKLIDRLKAVEALGQVKGDDSYNTLISLLRSPRADMRAAAATALGALGDQKARAHIDHLSKTEQDSVVLEAMKQALSKLHSNE